MKQVAIMQPQQSLQHNNHPQQREQAKPENVDVASEFKQLADSNRLSQVGGGPEVEPAERTHSSERRRQTTDRYKRQQKQLETSKRISSDRLATLIDSGFSNNQKEHTEQRIKVTLSAPRNSSDLQAFDSPILLDSERSASTINQPGGSENISLSSKRQSTATLISAASGPTDRADSNQTPGADKSVGPWTRLEQEAELRRIATGRANSANSNNSKQPQVRQQLCKQSPDPQDALANNNNNNQPQAPNPKQLAIYINGKIRSNSIFCRSSSSNSFNSLLNRFQLPGQQQPQADPFDEKQCPLRPCHSNPSSREQQLRQPGTTTASLRLRFNRRSGRRLVTHLQNRTHKLLTSYLFATDHTAAGASEPEPSVQDPLVLKAGRESDSSDSKAAPQSASGAKEEELQQEQEEAEEEIKTSYKLNPSSMFLRKAMRYYRLWIYCTNLTILLGTLIFILSSLYVVSDYRIKLLVSPPVDRRQTLSPKAAIGWTASGNDSAEEQQAYGSSDDTGDDEGHRFDELYISYSEPCVILAYAAIAVQAGLLQAIGCFGAVRMKERWIQTFWYLIMSLTVFDVVFLMYWMNRYDLLAKSLRRHMSHRLISHYGHLPANFSSWSPGELHSSPDEQLFASKMDKILTDIIDKIQSDSQCCGITNSLDYKHSLWRGAKVSQLARELNWTMSAPDQAALIRHVPLVPASCCRPAQLAPKGPAGGNGRGRHPSAEPLDDAQRGRPNRVPAWSPSMVVENLREPQRSSRTRSSNLGDGRREDAISSGSLEIQDNDELTLAELIDRRWERHRFKGPNVDDAEDADTDYSDNLGGDQPDNSLSKQQRRLLAKQDNFNRDGAIDSSSQHDRPRRQTDEGSRAQQQQQQQQHWTTMVASRVDERQRVLTRLIDWTSIDYMNEPGDSYNESATLRVATDSPEARLAKIRQLLFGGQETSEIRFRWPNKLQLTFAQYKIIEGYLMELSAEAQRADEPRDDAGGQSSAKSRRSISALDLDGTGDDKSPEDKEHHERLKQRLIEALKRDPELACAPRSYYDQATLYTQGCQPSIRAWLDSSAHILFVTGFCVLTVLKFCSVVLLRLEIREMIHKIKVLKGMATEYNALHDLEAYLPRPSVCAQAAELTPSGVTAALSSPTNQVPTGAAPCGCAATVVGGSSSSAGAQTTASATVKRLGGSFSEAVAAATAAAAAGQVGGPSAFGQLGASGRAASMKAMAAMSAMLTPINCPRSTSSSSAHLHAGSTATLGQKAAIQMMRSADLFQANNVMSRRHTAVSVCPAAAAAAAAAHHLMSRRGTYVANPIFGGHPPGAGSFCAGFGLNLSQHRHSAHTVTTSTLLNPQQLITSNTIKSPTNKHYLCDAHLASGGSPHSSTTTNNRQDGSNQTTMEHQSSAESANPLTGQSCQFTRSSAGSHQLLSLMYPFKRQSSGGAQSAGNFSLDLAPASLVESRRSIH